MTHYEAQSAQTVEKIVESLRQAYARASQESSDPRTHTTAVLFSEDGEPLITGFNRPVAPGLLEKDSARLTSPEKYFWIEHSERATLQEAAKKGVSTDGKSMGCSLFPCVDCARAIVGTGIKALVTTTPDFSDARWGDEFRRALETLDAGGVEVVLIDKARLAPALLDKEPELSAAKPRVGGF